MVGGLGLPETARKELYSLAYTSAVAAKAGLELLHIRFDFDSVDCQLISTKGRRPQMGLQLKATSTDRFEGDELVFDLPVKNYNDLRDDQRYVPTMLVVLHLPQLESHWLQFTHNDMLLRNAAYYYNLVGMPATTNTSTVRLRIPVAQRFNPDSVEMLMEHIGLYRILP
jgi:hypothetical protein